MLIYLLVFYFLFDWMIVWCDGLFVIVCVFVVDVVCVVVVLFVGGYVFNVCCDCYCFVVSLCVVFVVGKISLLLLMYMLEMVC